MFNANLRLNNLQLYVETSRKKANVDLELQQLKETIESQAKEIEYLKCIVNNYRSEREDLLRILQRDTDNTVQDSESESSVLSFEERVTSPYFSPSSPSPSSSSSTSSVTTSSFSASLSSLRKRKAEDVRGYFCEKCNNLAFTTQFSYDRHVRTIHERKFRFSCDKCTAGFETAARLTAHLQRIHNITRL